MVPPSSNTINLDRARQQRNASQVAPVRESDPLVLSTLRQRLLSVLQSSLDLERVLQLFRQEVDTLVDVPGLAYRNAAEDVVIRLGEEQGHQVHYHLSQGGIRLGELTFYRQERFQDSELSALEHLLGTLLFPLRNALLYREAQNNALRDALTGVGNRNALDRALVRELELARRTQQPLSLLMLDLDHFKRINDRFGHSVGDDVLRQTARTLSNCLRSMDMIFRFGGEEFCVLLSATGHEAAHIVAERLRAAVEAQSETAGAIPLPVTLSLGLATLRDVESPRCLLLRADRALYQAKAEGRNRSCGLA
ncbi:MULTISPECIES: GGDEF domain-containing protein [Pseudomonas]|uniref:GGDEF domain-containing protein n=1 Tax=Pseudomonas TaxID=286 RepID=UPI0003167F77|nr:MULTISPECIES: GGDEF domain-containing protein [Pseudomonas]MDC7827765.1 GGDEF domain-containing protein [Pseudomonas benzopyrenica]